MTVVSTLLEQLVARDAKDAVAIARTQKLWLRFRVAIRDERKRRKIGLTEFARLLGVSPAFVGYLERGSRPWKLDMARKAVSVLGK